jgi:8-oxo-dGTP pyrophosphatase MutT (NUDIX family)
VIPDEVLRRVLDPLDRSWRSRPDARDAAVLAPWFTRGGRDFLLFIVRRPDLPHHAGEIAFPGGGRQGDEDALTCALRETTEEIGLMASAIDPLGALGDRQSSAGFRVRTFVGRIAPPATLAMDPAEVAAVLEVAVDELQDRGRWSYRDVGEGANRRAGVPFFALAGRDLWGLTARISLDLVARLPLASGPHSR